MKKIIFLSLIFCSTNLFAEFAISKVRFHFSLKNTARLFKQKVSEYGVCTPIYLNHLYKIGRICSFDLLLSKDSTKKDVIKILNSTNCKIYHRIDCFSNNNYLFSLRHSKKK